MSNLIDSTTGQQYQLGVTDGRLTIEAVAAPVFSAATTRGSNSTITLQDIMDDAATLGDIAPALATGGYSDSPARSIATDVMAALILGGPLGQPFNWKWNRLNFPAFTTISYQQDYFVPGVVNLGWLEDAWMVNINQASVPKQKVDLEVHRDLEVAYFQSGYPAKICWLPNEELQTGAWGQHPFGPTVSSPAGETNVAGPGMTGMLNPGPGVVYTNPVGALQTPINATTCITDPSGNCWVLTTYGTCGDTPPTWPAFPAYPTFQDPSTVATTLADGSCVWTAINPKGQGFRLNSIPPQAGVVWSVNAVGQMRPPTFTTTTQTLEPIPDDYVSYFKQGFLAECYRRNPDPQVRGRYPMERQLWLEALNKAVRQGQRELDDYGFYPGAPLMDNYRTSGPRPDQPYGWR